MNGNSSYSNALYLTVTYTYRCYYFANAYVLWHDVLILNHFCFWNKPWTASVTLKWLAITLMKKKRFAKNLQTKDESKQKKEEKKRFELSSHVVAVSSVGVCGYRQWPWQEWKKGQRFWFHFHPYSSSSPKPFCSSKNTTQTDKGVCFADSKSPLIPGPRRLDGLAHQVMCVSHVASTSWCDDMVDVLLHVTPYPCHARIFRVSFDIAFYQGYDVRLNNDIWCLLLCPLFICWEDLCQRSSSSSSFFSQYPATCQAGNISGAVMMRHDDNKAVRSLASEQEKEV